MVNLNLCHNIEWKYLQAGNKTIEATEVLAAPRASETDGYPKARLAAEATEELARLEKIKCVAKAEEERGRLTCEPDVKIREAQSTEKATKFASEQSSQTCKYWQVFYKKIRVRLLP